MTTRVAKTKGVTESKGTAKQKSSSGRPFDKRHAWDESVERHNTTQRSEAHADCDRLRLWRNCPAPGCLRVRGCTGDPRRCREQRRPAVVSERPLG